MPGVIEDGTGGAATDRGSLTKTGAGRLTLSGANTYTGLTTVSNGVLRISHNTALGGGTGSQARTIVASGARLELSSSGTTGLNVGETLDLFGTLANQSGDNEYSGAINLKGTRIDNSTAGSTLTVSGDLSLEETPAGGETVARDLRVTGVGDVVLSGVISGLGGITKGSVNTDTGILTVSGNNTFAGAVNVNHGTLRVQHNNALGTPGGTTTNGGTTVAGGATLALAGGTGNLSIPASEVLRLAGTLRNLNALANNTWNGAITLTGNATIESLAQTLILSGNIGLNSGDTATRDLIVTGAGDISIQGNIQTGAGGLSKSGAGTLTLSGTNTYTGDTTVSGGELELANTATSGQGAIIDTGAVILTAGTGAKLTIAQNETLSSLTGGGAASDGTGVGETAITIGRTLTLKGGGQYAGRITGAGNLTYDPGNATTLFTLSGNSDYTGLTTVSSGILAIASDTALGAATGATTVSNGATLRLAGNGLTVAETLNLAGTLANPSGNNEYSGNITLTDDATLNSATAGNTLTVSGTVSLGIASNAHALTVTGAGNTVINGAISGAGGLTKTGSGTLTLGGTAANTYAGVTNVSAGVLRIRKNSALGNTTGNTTVAAGATLELDSPVSGTSRTRLTIPAGEALNLAGTLRNRNAGGTPADNIWNGAITLTGNNATIDNAVPAGGTVNSLTLAGNITGANQNLTVTGVGNTRIQGNIQTGPGSLTKTGDGTLTLSGSTNNYTGATTISGGTLALGVAEALPRQQSSGHRRQRYLCPGQLQSNPDRRSATG